MDRFYPMGLTAEEGVWKTSYEVQNELVAFERSPYPPGTAIHLPGARDQFGFSTPGPIASRLAKPSLALTQQVDVANPREHHAIPRMQEHDDRETFYKHDVPEMMRSYRSQVATMSMSPNGNKSMSRTRSLPAMERKPMPPKLGQENDSIEYVEDDHFDYFVPKGLQQEGRDKLHAGTLSRLQKRDRISYPFTGEGTGFRAQSSAAEFMAKGYESKHSTTHQSAYTKPPFFRISAAQQAMAFSGGKK